MAILDKGAIGGVALIVIAVVWFVVGYQAGYIYYYPPVLALIGVVGVIHGLSSSSRRRRGRPRRGRNRPGRRPSRRRR